MRCLPACRFRLKNILNTNDKSEPVSHLEDSVRIIMKWPGRLELNLSSLRFTDSRRSSRAPPHIVMLNKQQFKAIFQHCQYIIRHIWP